jgi:Protein of unknown function (DUF3995)
MTYKLGILLAIIFAALSLLHIYWASGGTFGSGATVPSVGSKPVFNPSPVGTILVAAALATAMLTILGQLNILGGAIPKWIFRWATWAISLLFFLRAVGEFRLIGFFKQVRETQFAAWDTWLYSPLCLVIAIIAFLLAYKEA